MADFLDDMLNEAPETANQDAPPPETIAPAPEAIATEPQAEPQPEPEPLQPPVEKPEPGTVPLSALLDTRDKLKAAEARARQLEAERQQQHVPDDIPDPLDDPDGFRTHMRGQQAAFQRELEAAKQQTKMDMSWAFAVQQHGQEKAEAARQWALEKAQTDEAFAKMLDIEAVRQPMPIDWVIQQHQRDALLSDIGGNVDDWFTREAAKRGYALQSAPVQAVATAPVQQASRPVAPPRSIASDVSAPSNPTPMDDKAGFLAAFK